MYEIVNSILGLDDFTIRRLVTIWVILWVTMLVTVFIDMRAGMHRAKILNEKIHSHGLRETFRKFGEYGFVTMLCMLIDAIAVLFGIFNLPYVSAVSVVGAIVIEGISVYESLKAVKSQSANVAQIVSGLIKSASAEEVVGLLKQFNEIKSEVSKLKHKT